MSMNTINGVVNQINNQAEQISGTSTLKPFISDQKVENNSQFSDILFNSVNDISDMQKQSKQLSEAYMSGEEGIGLNDVMVSVQKSSLALNMGVQVRNKLVSAYQDIMNMQV